MTHIILMSITSKRSCGSEWVWFPLSVKITINHRSVLLVFTTIDRKGDLVKMKSNREREREREVNNCWFYGNKMLISYYTIGAYFISMRKHALLNGVVLYINGTVLVPFLSEKLPFKVWSP